MFKTFSETIHSIKDANYGNVIIEKGIKYCVHYWLNYLVAITLIPIVLFIGLVTYLVPQLSKLITISIPSGKVEISNGKLISNVKQPFFLGSQEFGLVLDTSSVSGHIYDKYNGILLLSDKLVIKGPNGDNLTKKYSELSNSTITTQDVINWVNKNQIKIWFILCGIILATSLASLLIYIGYKIFTILIWSGLLFTIATVLKKNIKFSQIVCISLYASVPPLVISLFASMLFIDNSSLITLIVFILLSLRWIINLQLDTRYIEKSSKI